MGVRWDAVVECGSRRFEPARATAARPPLSAGTPAPVEVWLFGSLADSIPERPLRLQLGNPFTIADVIAELGRRGGAEFLAKVTAADGGLLSHCRVFVNGEPVEEIRVPLGADDSAAQIEMILLTAAEGG